MMGPQSGSDLRQALRVVLGVILPDAAETNLLRAILHDGDDARRAWREWCDAVGSPLDAFKGERLGQKSLLPLLHVSVERNSLDVAAAVASWLRAAYFREELRGNAYRRILDETLAVIAHGSDGSPPVVLKGCALSETVYDDPATRHSHGIELLLRDAAVARVVGLLPGAGFAPARRHQLRRRGRFNLYWRHAVGLPLELRSRLFDVARYNRGGIEAAWRRAQPLPGFAALQLGPEDALLHVCGNAVTSGSRISLRWACDAWLLLRRHGGFDWNLFVELVDEARLGLPVSTVMRYLAESLQAPVPARVLDALDALAAGTDLVGHEIAAMGALVGSHSRVRRLILARPGWSARLALLRCFLAPSTACVTEMGWVTQPRQLPLYYLMRPLGYVGRRLARLAARPETALPRRMDSR